MSWDWTEIGDIFERTLERHGVSPESSRFLARAIAAELRHAVGGGAQYIPKRVASVEEAKDLFDGRNYRELAQLFGVSERTIRRWVDGR